MDAAKARAPVCLTFLLADVIASGASAQVLSRWKCRSSASP
jgi:hypothetical protein